MENGLLFQGFEWHISDDGNYYKDLILKLDELKEIGTTAIWLPPVYKGTGTNDVGYGVYDLFDLGEFDQKGSVRTKYGSKEELKNLIQEIHKRDMKVYADVVINHKAGADRTEKFMAVMVDQEDRTKEVEEPKEIEGWTGFDFEGRGEKYSDFKCAVIISNGDINTIKMFVGKEQASKTYVDFLGNNAGKITIDEEGFGDFMVSAGSISVWTDETFSLS